MRGDGLNTWVEAFSPEAPGGERREVVSATWGSRHQARLLEDAGVALTGARLAE